MDKQTIGAYRVGVGRAFNPSGNPLVDEIKKKSAELIDLISTIDTVDGEPSGRYLAEFNRRKAHAMTLVNDACMNAVGAATLLPPSEG